MSNILLTVIWFNRKYCIILYNLLNTLNIAQKFRHYFFHIFLYDISVFGNISQKCNYVTLEKERKRGRVLFINVRIYIYKI